MSGLPLRLRTFGAAFLLATWFAPSTPAQGASYPVIVIAMRMVGESHELKSAVIVQSPRPLGAITATLPTIQYSITDDRMRVLASGEIDDPRVQRGALPATKGEPEGHETSLQSTADYVVRAPFSADARYLVIATRTAQDPSTAVEQVFDLASVVAN